MIKNRSIFRWQRRDIGAIRCNAEMGTRCALTNGVEGWAIGKVSSVLSVLTLVVSIFGHGQMVHAFPILLEAGNSSVLISDADSGVVNWRLGGVDQVSIFRRGGLQTVLRMNGGNPKEIGLRSLTLNEVNETNRSAVLSFSGTEKYDGKNLKFNADFDLQIGYELTSPRENVSILNQQIALTFNSISDCTWFNNECRSDNPFTRFQFHLFQYANFDLQDVEEGNAAEVIYDQDNVPLSIHQARGNTKVDTFFDREAPTVDISTSPILADKLGIQGEDMDGTTTLQPFPLNATITGDLEWAAQWSFFAGGSQLPVEPITYVTNVRYVMSVPEPATLGLFGLGLIGLGLAARRRKTA